MITRDDVYKELDSILCYNFLDQSVVHAPPYKWVRIDGRITGLRAQCYHKGHAFYIPFKRGIHLIEFVYSDDEETEDQCTII